MGSLVNYHLYTDGSAFSDTNRYGIGWVRTNHKDRKPSFFSKRLKLNRATSLIAELYAVSRALDHIRKNSKIHLNTDCADICSAIAENAIPERIKRARKTPTLKEAWEAVDKAIKRHTNVTVFYVHHDKEHPHLYMDTAHNLAQIGASKAFNKASKDGGKGMTNQGRSLRKGTKGHSLDEPSAYEP